MVTCSPPEAKVKYCIAWMDELIDNYYYYSNLVMCVCVLIFRITHFYNLHYFLCYVYLKRYSCWVGLWHLGWRRLHCCFNSKSWIHHFTWWGCLNWMTGIIHAVLIYIASVASCLFYKTYTLDIFMCVYSYSVISPSRRHDESKRRCIGPAIG